MGNVNESANERAHSGRSNDSNVELPGALQDSQEDNTLDSSVPNVRTHIEVLNPLTFACFQKLDNDRLPPSSCSSTEVLINIFFVSRCFIIIFNLPRMTPVVLI
jgi:hypothetical protein